MDFQEAVVFKVFSRNSDESTVSNNLYFCIFVLSWYIV